MNFVSKGAFPFLENVERCIEITRNHLPLGRFDIELRFDVHLLAERNWTYCNYCNTTPPVDTTTPATAIVYRTIPGTFSWAIVRVSERCTIVPSHDLINCVTLCTSHFGTVCFCVPGCVCVFFSLSSCCKFICQKKKKIVVSCLIPFSLITMTTSRRH